jgi:hypothetical protein
MRRWFLATAATLFAAAAMTPAGALPLGPAAVRPAVEAVNPVEQTICWRQGWRGWGWYPCWGWYGSLTTTITGDARIGMRMTMTMTMMNTNGTITAGGGDLFQIVFRLLEVGHHWRAVPRGSSAEDGGSLD